MIRRRSPEPRALTDEEQIAIVRALLDLRRQGALEALWCDAGRLRVRVPGDPLIHALPWRDAARLALGDTSVARLYPPRRLPPASSPLLARLHAVRATPA